jgi:hypothetical protein
MAVVFGRQYPYAALNRKRNGMARTPNYNYERQERDRQKAAKKAEKLAAKAAAKEDRTKSGADTDTDAETEPQQ